MRIALCVAVACLASTAPNAAAQMPGAAAKRAATAAVNATNAHTTAEVKVAGAPVTPQATTKPAPAKASPTKPAPTKPAPTNAAATKLPATKSVAKSGTTPSTTPKPGTALAIGTRSDTAGPPPVIMREVFVYDGAGRRDPFVSLLTTSELRPALSDLKLTGILYDMSGRRPVATLRDITNNTQYTVTTGTALGRMRVAAIRPKTVIFSIDEFGASRLDSLVLGDSTKVRAK